MEQARVFVYELIRQKRLNIGHFLDFKWLWLASANESPVIKNNYLNVIKEMIEQGFLEQRTGHEGGAFLTDLGFNAIYNQ